MILINRFKIEGYLLRKPIYLTQPHIIKGSVIGQIHHGKPIYDGIPVKVEGILL
jgi:hypothetical protein